MRVGTVCYATDQGLGLLAKDFFDECVVTHPFVLRHSSRPTHKGWYPPGTPVFGMRDHNLLQILKLFCSQVDVMLFFETPFHWDLIPYCREVGVRTVLMPMYECMPTYFPQPDLIVNPSTLDQEYYPDGVHIPVPVPDAIAKRWRRRERARVFVHNAGHGGLKGRNGTMELLEAIQYVKSPIELIVRSQRPLEFSPSLNDERIKFKIGTFPREELYDEGDVFIFPEKFNGLSLPLQEAFASGMLVMGTHRDPMNKWLPPRPLIPLQRYVRSRISSRCVEFSEAVHDPHAIAEHIDRWFDVDISFYSESGAVFARNELSWDELKPRYLQVLKP